MTPQSALRALDLGADSGLVVTGRAILAGCRPLAFACHRSQGREQGADSIGRRSGQSIDASRSPRAAAG
jgi:hypothetical protein